MISITLIFLDSLIFFTVSGLYPCLHYVLIHSTGSSPSLLFLLHAYTQSDENKFSLRNAVLQSSSAPASRSSAVVSTLSGTMVRANSETLKLRIQHAHEIPIFDIVCTLLEWLEMMGCFPNLSLMQSGIQDIVISPDLIMKQMRYLRYHHQLVPRQVSGILTADI